VDRREFERKNFENHRKNILTCSFWLREKMAKHNIEMRDSDSPTVCVCVYAVCCRRGYEHQEANGREKKRKRRKKVLSNSTLCAKKLVSFQLSGIEVRKSGKAKNWKRNYLNTFFVMITKR
jgi:hypothetical protein